MTSVDQFESVFRAADKAVFRFQRAPIERAVVVTDGDTEQTERLLEQVRAYLSALGEAVTWVPIAGDRYSSVAEMLRVTDQAEADLIITYRHLHSEGWHWGYGLGEHLDVLTQLSDSPVLVVPHPDANLALPHSLSGTGHVMAITDHLAGDDRLVNYAVSFTSPGGRCGLTHIEDGASFDRFASAVAKIPDLDTDTTRELVLAQLLKEPREYIESCRRFLEHSGVDLTIETTVKLGHRITEYSSLIEENDVDLLVMNTKDEDQLAMHGLAYPLAVELRRIPLLML